LRVDAGFAESSKENVVPCPLVDDSEGLGGWWGPRVCLGCGSAQVFPEGRLGAPVDELIRELARLRIPDVG
jgi:hypothetical protein